MTIAILDTGGANHASIRNALARLGKSAELTLDAAVLARASHVILPGVGHAGFAMERIEKAGLRAALLARTKPVLGICLGMQILFSRSEEGDTACLGLLPGEVRKLTATAEFRVPHMGWNQLRRRSGAAGRLLEGVSEDAHFYFVHSFAAPENAAVTHTTRSAGTEPLIPAVVEAGNFCGTQFHPERSGEPGARILQNFLRWEAR